MRSMVIRPSLKKLGLHSTSGEELVPGTAIIESGLTYLKQHGDGPALGLWQIEPPTHEDLYTNFLNYRPELGSILMELRAPNLSMGENLATNQRSTLRMKLNRGEYLGAADEFPKWRRAGGRILAGLVRRRAAERALFLA